MKVPLDYLAPIGMLHEQVVLVTGAGDGIGRELSIECAKLGATVVLLGRTVRKLEAVYDAIVAGGGAEPAIFPIDFRGATPEHYQQLADGVANELGRLDALVHNAAVLGPLSPIGHYSPKEWYEVMQVNVNAGFHLAHALLPLLSRATTARVVFVSCDVGRRARAYWGAYAVSKFALEGLMQVLADEVESDARIKVVSLDPGPTATGIRAAAYPAADPNKVLTAAEVIPAFLYVLGPQGEQLHGLALRAQ